MRYLLSRFGLYVYILWEPFIYRVQYKGWLSLEATSHSLTHFNLDSKLFKSFCSIIKNKKIYNINGLWHSCSKLRIKIFSCKITKQNLAINCDTLRLKIWIEICLDSINYKCHRINSSFSQFHEKKTSNKARVLKKRLKILISTIIHLERLKRGQVCC
jgi:hypothetical protein